VSRVGGKEKRIANKSWVTVRRHAVPSQRPASPWRRARAGIDLMKKNGPIDIVDRAVADRCPLCTDKTCLAQRYTSA